MFSTSIIRYFIFCVLIIHSFGIGRNERSDNKIDSKDQRAKKVNILDMFNDFNNRASKSTDDTFYHGFIKEKEKVPNSKPSHMDEKSCPSVGKYRTVVVSYRSVAKSWTDKLLLASKDAKRCLLTIDFSPRELAQLKRFALSSDYDQDIVLHDVRDISHYLITNAYVSKEDNSSYTGLTWSTWIRSYNINSINQVALGITVLAVTIGFFFFRIPVRPAQGLVLLFIVCFIASVYQNWHALYQEEKAKISHILMKGPPKGCESQSRGVINTITTFFTSFFQLPVDRCLDFHKALHAKPHLKATIVQAVSMTIAQFFVTPLELIGESLSMFFAATMRHVPKLAWPFVIAIIVFLILVVIFMCHGRQPNNNQQQALFELQKVIAQLQNENQRMNLQLQQIQNPQIE